MHAADERIDVRDLGFAAAFFHDLPREAADAVTAKDKLRLGGMALRNGLLVHGPTHWAAAVRTDAGRAQGRLRAEAAPARRRRRARRARARPPRRGVRGHPARQARPARGPAAVRGRRPWSGWRPARRSPARCCAAARAASPARRRPALIVARAGAVRAARRRARRLPRRRAQGDRRLRGRRGGRRRRAKEHERCGSHLVAPMLVVQPRRHAAAATRRASGRAPLAGGAVALASTAAAVEVFAWSERHAGTPVARALKRRASSSSALIGTREPDERQLEVGPRGARRDPARRRLEAGGRLDGHTGVATLVGMRESRADTGSR